MTPEHPRRAESGRETEPRPELRIESRASSRHPERNEDAALGDPKRLESESLNQPELHTANITADLKLLADCAAKERAAAEGLATRQIIVIYDGVSGSSDNGAGLLASRLAAGVMAERLAAGDQPPSAHDAADKILAAMLAAHDGILDYRERRPDLREMATTCVAAWPFPRDGGGFDVAYGHSGDSRLYTFNRLTKKLTARTRDHGAARLAQKEGRLTDEDLAAIDAAGDAADLPTGLQIYFLMRNRLAGGLGIVMTNQIDPESGVFTMDGDESLFGLTDGVTDNLTPAQIAERLGRGETAADLVRAAAEIAAANTVRSKPDDMTAVELNPTRPEPDDRRPRGDGENADVWLDLRREVADASERIAGLERLVKIADQMEGRDDDAPSTVRTEDLAAIQRFGSPEALRAALRDERIESLDRRAALLGREAGAGAIQQADELRRAVANNGGLAAAVRFEAARLTGKNPVAAGDFTEAQYRAAVNRLDFGPPPDSLIAQYESAAAEMSGELAKLIRLNPALDEFLATSDELIRLRDARDAAAERHARADLNQAAADRAA
jgi:serine/threonine protein phosphatase PrpC